MLRLPNINRGVEGSHLYVHLKTDLLHSLLSMDRWELSHLFIGTEIIGSAHYLHK